MAGFICRTCGVQFAESTEPPEECPVCLDERQYVGSEGQIWTTPDELRQQHQADIREEEPGLTGIGMKPSFAIGQRALLLETPDGNVLWDCIPLLAEEMVSFVRSRGGLAAIAISHPHYYASLVEWGSTFGARVYLHQADSRWVMRQDPCIHFWSGEECELLPDVNLLRLGGHFAGGTVLHWRGGEKEGTLLSGDVVQVVADRRWLSFMRSYPNYIPLSSAEVQAIRDRLEPLKFDRIYGAWYDRVVASQGKEAFRRSAERYLAALRGLHAGD
ncbi:MAG: MBL fold metallo-hydrolase [Candidatus Dormibacteraeota bacterium]|uniref:MBL fold metallo-hydrolase n=1 Tax=Candidatus Dormiibacter inghamiae TaxID=3127013 RepID=A0A934KIK9_9BACT|nr:MBL fold metallo-hydrolase [Candidatus Dormibacteraeota bacterium]MBJ7606425.1 MBL fold metallo-hydrolase [Candidatus Dormibacteraeota bacterium]